MMSTTAPPETAGASSFVMAPVMAPAMAPIIGEPAAS